MTSFKNNVILDLDQTLISAYLGETEFPFDQKGIKNRVCNFKLHNLDNEYLIFERPNLQDFLDWLFAHYNVAVWTAASKDYALFIVENVILIKPERKLDFVLFSYHCDISERIYRYHKQLKFLADIVRIDGYTLNNTLIIDDHDKVYECQPLNCIHIFPFEMLALNSENDDKLNIIKDQIITKFLNMNN